MKHLKLYNIEYIQQHKAFKKRLTDQGRSQSGIDNLTDRINEFFHFLEQQQVESPKKITQKHILDYHHYLQTRTNLRTSGMLSDKYMDKHGEAIMRYMEMLTGRKQGESGFEYPFSTPSYTDIEILTPAEIEQIYQAMDNSMVGISNRAILSLLYGCGLRSGELATLELNDIDFLRQEIILDNTKTKYERTVPMTPTVVKHLEEYLYYGRNLLLPREQDETFVMINQNGYQMTTPTIGNRVKHIVKEAGITKRVYSHLLRHSIGSHLVDHLSIEEIAEFLGHRDLSSTQIYTHLAETIR